MRARKALHAPRPGAAAAPATRRREKEEAPAKRAPVAGGLAGRGSEPRPARGGDGARTKLVNNLAAAINLVGAAEVLVMAQKMLSWQLLHQEHVLSNLHNGPQGVEDRSRVRH